MVEACASSFTHFSFRVSC